MGGSPKDERNCLVLFHALDGRFDEEELPRSGLSVAAVSVENVDSAYCFSEFDGFGAYCSSASAYVLLAPAIPPDCCLFEDDEPYDMVNRIFVGVFERQILGIVEDTVN